MANLPYPNIVNSQGIPALLGKPSLETIGAVETLVITFAPHRELNANWSGEFDVLIDGAVVTGAQPVVFRTSGVTGYVPLYLYSGPQATAAALQTTTGGIIKCFYKKDTDRLQLMGNYS